jgi:regulator of protease activity HflC (stomatin/prohibitin superfamily)
MTAMKFLVFVNEKEEVLIQRFGKYVRTLNTPGIHVIMPWENEEKRVGTGLRQIEDTLNTKTKDDIFVDIPIKMHLQVIDSRKYHYDSETSPDEQVIARVNATVKQLISDMEFTELYQTREQISGQAREKVGSEIEHLYGMRLIDVIVDQPHADAKAIASFSSVKESERNKQATINNAEADKLRTIADAEARKEALRLHGEGIAEQRNAIFQNYAEQFNNLANKGMSPEMAHEIILLAMALDTTRDAAEKGNVILTTTNAGDLLTQVQALGKTLTKPRPANDGGPADMPAPAQKAAAQKPPAPGKQG